MYVNQKITVNISEKSCIKASYFEKCHDYSKCTI
jgi:hypothetical protein